jgi:large subunit ribosomal protein L54
MPRNLTNRKFHETAKSKKQRRIAAKALRKQQLLNPGLLEPKIPLYEQTIDLPAGDGSLQGSKDALAARAELTKAMRDKRRSKIKEDNFLKEMR